MFRTKMIGEDALDNYDCVVMLLAGTLRVADSAWVSRGPSQGQFMHFCDRFMDQFFVQGDLEKAIGMPASPFCDRDTTNAARVEFGYLVVVAQPASLAYLGYLQTATGGDAKELETGLDANLAQLQGWVRMNVDSGDS